MKFNIFNLWQLNFTKNFNDEEKNKILISKRTFWYLIIKSILKSTTQLILELTNTLIKETRCALFFKQIILFLDKLIKNSSYRTVIFTHYLITWNTSTMFQIFKKWKNYWFFYIQKYLKKKNYDHFLIKIYKIYENINTIFQISINLINKKNSLLIIDKYKIRIIVNFRALQMFVSIQNYFFTDLITVLGSQANMFEDVDNNHSLNFN